MTAIACGSHVPVQEENKTTDVIILKLHLLSNRVSLFPYAVEKTFCMQAQLCGTKCKQPVASLVLLAGKISAIPGVVQPVSQYPYSIYDHNLRFSLPYV